VRRRRRKHLVRTRVLLALPMWARTSAGSLDFMSDQVADGRVFRTLNIVDDSPPSVARSRWRRRSMASTLSKSEPLLLSRIDPHAFRDFANES